MAKERNRHKGQARTTAPRPTAGDLRDAAAGRWNRPTSQEVGGPLATPIDLFALQEDDRLIEAIRQDRSVETSTAADYELALLLTRWRDDVLSEPLPLTPSVDDAMDLVTSAEGSGEGISSRRGLILKCVSAAAITVAVACAAVTFASQNASPGSPLWGVKAVVFSERAVQTQDAQMVSSHLADAQQLIDEGRTDAALTKLEAVKAKVGALPKGENQSQLNAWWQRIYNEAKPAPQKVDVSRAPHVTITVTAPSSQMRKAESLSSDSQRPDESIQSSMSSSVSSQLTSPQPTPTADEPSPSTPVNVAPPAVPESGSVATSTPQLTPTPGEATP